MHADWRKIAPAAIVPVLDTVADGEEEATEHIDGDDEEGDTRDCREMLKCLNMRARQLEVGSEFRHFEVSELASNFHRATQFSILALACWHRTHHGRCPLTAASR
eukprot:1634489-Alexandrium_andersonii.AAC.1